MKKFLTLSLFVAAFAFSATFASAQNFPQNNRNDQRNDQRNDRYNDRNDRRYDRRNDRNWGNKRVRVVTQTRIVRQGRQTYRETIQIKYFPNGRTETKVIKRVRIR